MENAENTGSLLSVHEAAATLKTTVPKVLMMIKNGGLIGQLVDGEWEINGDSICNCPLPQSIPHAKGGCGGCSSCG